MALEIKHKDTKISVGDVIRVVQKIKEKDKSRLQAFEGLLIAIKGSKENASIMVRRIGEAQIGIERIFPLASPLIEEIRVVKTGGRGIRQAKLYYVRNKSRKEIEKIFSRTAKKSKKSPTTLVVEGKKKTKGKK
jgi:large subunit ribosomal protein L19